MIEFVRAPAFATVQDGGRDGFRRSGVPPGGAMDWLSLAAGNALLGNESGAAAVEWALTGGELRFHDPHVFTLTGAAASARLNDVALPRGTTVAARAGDTLVIHHIERGRFLYLCLRGGIAVPPVLGGRGTYLPAGFGGLDGRRIRDGDRLPTTRTRGAAPSGVTLPAAADVLADDEPIRLLPGPQASLLSREEWAALLGSELTVAADADRAGYRLSGARVSSRHQPAGTSEPACVGAVQLTPDGTLIVLMPDGPTVGGYPKIGVITSADLPRVAQTVVGGRVRLHRMDVDEAHAALRSRHRMLEEISALTRTAAEG